MKSDNIIVVSRQIHNYIFFKTVRGYNKPIYFLNLFEVILPDTDSNQLTFWTSLEKEAVYQTYAKIRMSVVGDQYLLKM